MRRDLLSPSISWPVRTASMTGDRVQWGCDRILFLSVTGLPQPDHPATVLRLQRMQQGRIWTGYTVRWSSSYNNNCKPATRRQNRAGKLETRLYLPQCRQLEAYLPADSRLAGKTRIGVHCLQPIEWSIMVPVTISNQRQRGRSGAAGPLGQEISADDLGMRQLGTGETAPAATLISADQAIKGCGHHARQGLALWSDMLCAPISSSKIRR